MRSYRYLVATSAAVIFLGAPSALWAQVAPDLGAAAPFAVLGANAVPIIGTVTCTDTGPGIGITGQVGTTFAGGITNVGPCTITGPIVSPVGGGVVAAFNSALGAIDVQNPVCTGGIPIVSTILAPGVYCSAAGTTIGVGVTLTLSGNASDVWIFRVGTGGPGALTITGGSVVMGGSALACNVYWKTSAATALTDVPSFVGTVLSGAAVTMTRTNWIGRAMATTDVTLTDPIPMTFAGCAAPASITVIKDFIPNNVATVPISLACTSGTVTTAPPNFSEAAPAVFRLGGASLAGATCTATETVPAGFTANQANCVGVALNGSCTIINTRNACPAITLSPAVLSNGTVGVAYSQTITASGGIAPYTFTVPPGTLPAGLTLSAAGVLSGTPTTAETQTFTVTATDANGCASTQTYTVVITSGGTPPPAGCPVITLAPTTLPDGVVGVAYSQQLTAAGGVGTITFTRTAGSSIPPGLTLSTGGLISGTPTVSLFPDSFTIRATDANGCFVELPYTMAILAGVPTLPQTFVIVIFLGLLLIGYAQLRNRRRV
ncbi:MAG: putative Ig domain-containing protein [Acidobacteriota bacterium]|nr:putative Ig domain-containing protein [Acidobacteriota bacterium]